MILSENKFLLVGIGIAAIALLYLVKRPGAAAQAGTAVGQAAVEAVGGVATGVLDGASQAVGIPTTSETITDVQECKRFMDANGVWAASFQCAAPAFIGAMTQ